ncbi:rabphilin 3A-like (without C2 domains), isoform CRA_b [Rattus norvegicus]|uniref:Rabphilin 3A-like (Without C2 domains), isoform CRA_b n=1 Tax=Rattus norvegicus TaxID=10116 RepID=A6HGU1_RAT|nr:rabphilin 3A-like (without C2 domains), isoform CRA_b [Rattus norvegicus]
MADTIFSSGNDQWVCPNDRQLALRAKLQTGWSVHTYQTEKQRRTQCLSPGEVEVILQVIQRAERLDILEQQRIGRLVERLETMQKNVMGNGVSQCLLCGEMLGFLGSSSVFCKDCRKICWWEHFLESLLILSRDLKCSCGGLGVLPSYSSKTTSRRWRHQRRQRIPVPATQSTA